MLELKNISKKFNHHVVLDDISITIPSSCIFGLVGLNGSGKSTLLRILANVYQADEGEIYYQGTKLDHNHPDKKNLLYISDDPYYSSSDTIQDIYALYHVFYSIDKKEFEQQLANMKMNHKMKLSDLSKGMRRQLYIALAFSIVPQILILDEAFDGLDPKARLAFKQKLVALMSEHEMTVIIASHSLRELDDICDQFAILQDAHILLQDLPSHAKQEIFKVQLALPSHLTLDDLKELNIQKILHKGKICAFVVKNDKTFLKEIFTKYQIPYYDIIDLSLEELFIYQVEDENHD